MTAKTTARTARPLSPHLGIYKPQLTSGMSVFHRGTGIALSFALPVFVIWLLLLSAPPELYGAFVNLFHNPVGQALLIGWTFAFFYHFCCGIRHIFWDAGYFLDINQVYTTGYIALAVSVLLTLVLWLKIYGVLP